MGGIDLVRSWGYEQTPSEPLSAIRFLIDGVEAELIVCYSPRSDVVAAFPSDVNARLSSWGLTLNWGNLAKGEHTNQIQFESFTGKIISSDTRTITVVRVGSASYPISICVMQR